MIDAGKLIAFFQSRRSNARQTFGTPWGKATLADIQEFCCADRTTATGDAHEMAIREGRRQVYLRISRAMNLTADEQFALLQSKEKPRE